MSPRSEKVKYINCQLIPITDVHLKILYTFIDVIRFTININAKHINKKKKNRFVGS